MFVNDASLPHVLGSTSYWSCDHYERERTALFLPGWHLVGTLGDLARPGDFLTCELFGVPIQVKNFAGRLVALSNVCAHRHCLLTSRNAGHDERLRCQYHGWEYGDDGRTKRIPEPKNFTPLDRDVHRLPLYRVDTCGQLVWVSLDKAGPTLREALGDLFDTCADRFGDGWEPFLSWQPTYDVNWKIPVENSLEAYHVPCIHPQTFREDPGEARSEHELNSHHTSFNTQLPFSPHSRIDAWFQKSEGWLLRQLGCTPSGRYSQHHVFPNLLFSFTDAVSVCHCVIPTGPTTSRAVVHQFGRVGRGAGPRRWLARTWGRLAASVTRRILREDMRLFGQIQAGLRASPHCGILGRCEERIHVFQEYVQRATGTVPPDESSICPSRRAGEPNHD